MEMRTYVLLKDLPDSKIGDEYIWNTVDEVYYKNGNNEDSWWRRKEVEDSPLWFKIKDDKIKVTNLIGIEGSNIIEIYFNKNVDEFKDKYPSIRVAIEGCINGKDPEPATSYLSAYEHHDNLINQLNKFHKIRLLKAEENAFNAGRLTHPMVGFKYDTFNDYKNNK